MEHAIHALHDAPTGVPVRHAPLDESNRSPDGCEIFPTARRQVVQYDDLFTCRYEMLDQVRADKACAAGY
jgi:hypothetical protein